jgi:hypothetical protein
MGISTGSPDMLLLLLLLPHSMQQLPAATASVSNRSIFTVAQNRTVTRTCTVLQ